MSDSVHSAEQPPADQFTTEQFTTEERDIVRAATLGALALVSRAEAGFFAAFRESVAGARALAQAPAPLRDLLAQGGLVHPPSGSAQQVELSVLEQVGQSVRILADKSDELLEGFRGVVVAGCDAVAEAAQGVSDQERQVIDRIRTALSGSYAAPAPPVPPAAPGGPPADAPAVAQDPDDEHISPS